VAFLVIIYGADLNKERGSGRSGSSSRGGRPAC